MGDAPSVHPAMVHGRAGHAACRKTRCAQSAAQCVRPVVVLGGGNNGCPDLRRRLALMSGCPEQSGVPNDLCWEGGCSAGDEWVSRSIREPAMSGCPGRFVPGGGDSGCPGLRSWSPEFALMSGCPDRLALIVGVPVRRVSRSDEWVSRSIAVDSSTRPVQDGGRCVRCTVGLLNSPRWVSLTPRLP